MAVSKQKITKAAKPYEPAACEKSTMSKVGSRTRAPRLKVIGNTIENDHPEPAVGTALLMEALGTTNLDFLNGLTGQLANVGTQGRKLDESALNFMLAMVKGIEPRDQVETMLAAQMAAVHNATMTFARRLNHVENIPQQDSAERAFNKLARTFASQVESLKRYRTGGEQKVTVQHVNVNDGGQAIVGNVQGGGGVSKKAGTTP